MVLQIEPLQNNVLLRRREQGDNYVEGGLIEIPDKFKNRAQCVGEVISVGPGVEIDGEFIATQVKAGDTVIFPDYAGQDFDILGDDMLVVNEIDCLVRIWDDGKPEEESDGEA